MSWFCERGETTSWGPYVSSVVVVVVEMVVDVVVVVVVVVVLLSRVAEAHVVDSIRFAATITLITPPIPIRSLRHLILEASSVMWRKKLDALCVETDNMNFLGPNGCRFTLGLPRSFSDATNANAETSIFDVSYTSRTQTAGTEIPSTSLHVHTRMDSESVSLITPATAKLSGDTQIEGRTRGPKKNGSCCEVFVMPRGTVASTSSSLTDACVGETTYVPFGADTTSGVPLHYPPTPVSPLGTWRRSSAL